MMAAQWTRETIHTRALRLALLHNSGAISTIRRARRDLFPTRDRVLFVAAMVVIGFLIGAHLAGRW